MRNCPDKSQTSDYANSICYIFEHLENTLNINNLFLTYNDIKNIFVISVRFATFRKIFDDNYFSFIFIALHRI